MNSWIRGLVLVVAGLLLAGCSGHSPQDMASVCRNSIESAERRFIAAMDAQSVDQMSALSMVNTANFAMASSLLGAARVQMMVGNYPGCLVMVEQARAHLWPSRLQSGFERQ